MYPFQVDKFADLLARLLEQTHDYATLISPSPDEVV